METSIARPRPAVHAYGYFACCAGYVQSFALLLLRIGFGFGLWISGYAHLTHIQDMVKRFVDWGVPLPTLSVWVSGTTEVAGGVLLLLGLGTRLVSIPLIINFIVAYATASRDEWKQFIHGPNRWGGWEDIVNDSAMPFFVAAWVTLAFGAGKVSIDYVLSRTIFRRPDRPATLSADVPPQAS